MKMGLGAQRARRSWASTGRSPAFWGRSEEHTSELQSQSNLVCRLLLEKKKKSKPDFLYVLIIYLKLVSKQINLLCLFPSTSPYFNIYNYIQYSHNHQHDPVPTPLNSTL